MSTLFGGDLPLPAGYVKNLLHLGVNASDRITGYPTSGQSILWDFMKFAGVGPEYLQQPQSGQSINLRLSVSSGGTSLTWSALTDADNDGLFKEGVGDNYVAYFALYIYVPTTRDVRMEFAIDDVLKVWLDGNPTPLLDTNQPAPNVTVSMTAGYHCLIFKLQENTGNDYFGVKFTNPDSTDMTDLLYTLSDPIAPSVRSTLPADGATGVATWSDVVFTFSEVMHTNFDPATVVSISPSAAGSWSWADPNTLMFMPSQPLAANTLYTATFNAANARDVSGNTLTGNTVFSFTTQSTLSSPGLTSISPATGSAGVTTCSLSGSGFITGNVMHPDNAVPFTNGHYYRFVKEMTHWHNARDLSAAAGGHLVTLQDASEDAFVWRLMGQINGWIGMSDQANEGVWVWVTGEPMTYTNWGPGMPDEWGNEHYGIYWWAFQWNDVPSDPNSQRPFVMEFESRQPPQVRLVKAGQTDIVASAVRFLSSGSLEFDVDLSGAASGTWDVVVVNPDGASAELAGAFSIDNTAPRVTGMTPTPASVLSTVPTEVLINFNKAVSSTSVNTNNLRLIRRGLDGQFGTADDVAIVPAGVSLVSSTQAKIDLTGVTLPNDVYRVVGGIGSIAGLAGHWTFDESSGATIYDSSGNGHHGTLSNGATRGPGVLGRALQLDGINDRALVPNSPGLDPTGGWTLACWVKTNTANRQYGLIEKYGDDGGNYVLRVMDNNKSGTYLIQYTSNQFLSGTTSLTPGTWYHLVSTYDNAAHALKLYVNGALEASRSTSGSALTTTDVLHLGSRGKDSAYVLDGLMDEARVYNRALTPLEVKALTAGRITDLAGNALDGEFSGTFPTGNGVSGGDFVAEFEIATLPRVVSLSIAPGGTVHPTPPEIVATFSVPLAPASVSVEAVRLVGRGPDNSFGTSDDVNVAVAGVNLVNGVELHVDLTGITLSPDVYTLTLSSRPFLANGLVAEYRLDASAGTIAADSSAQANNANLVNGPVWRPTQGRFGGALEFDGDDGYTQTQASASLEPTGGITVSAWARITDARASDVADLIRKENSGNGYTLRWSDSTGTMQWWINRGNEPVNPPTVLVTDTQSNSNYVNAWHHFAGTFDATTGVSKLYVDGVERASATGAPGNLEHSGPLWTMWTPIGNHAALPGLLDDVRIFNRALSTAEMALLATDRIRTSSGLVLDGEFSGTFPSGNGTPGGDFTVQFTIGASSVSVTAPNGGETLYAGQSSSITWNASGFTGNVDIELSTDGGANYTTLVTVPHSPGSYAWTVPNSPSNNCKIRVRRTTGGTPEDVSNAVFAIKPAPVKVSALSITSGSTLSVKPQEIVATFSKSVDPASLTAAFSLVRRGADETFGTNDDVLISPDNISLLSPTQLKMQLDNTALPNDAYRIKISEGPFIAQWKLNENVGTVAADSSGWQQNGTLYNAPVWEPGVSGSAIRFQYGNSYIEAPNLTGALGTEDFSVSLYVKTTDANQYTHLVGNRKSFDHANFWQVLIKPGGIVAFELDEDTSGNNYAQATSSVAIADGTWHYIKALRQGPQIKVYVDGQLSGSATMSHAFNMNNASSICMGNTPYTGLKSNERFIGMLDEVSIRRGTAAVLDLDGLILDGEFAGNFPSGNGIPGGDFVAEFTLNVQAPVAANLSLSTNEDVPVDGSLSASDANGDTLTYALASLPAKGTVQLNSATGAIRYTPSTNVNGTDSFTFTASDGTNTSNTATVTISIAPVNDAPSASALAFTLQEDQTLITTLSGSDPEGGTLVYLLATTPAKGTLTLSQTPQGQFLYVPQPNVSGTDQFTYRVFDGTTFSNTATVTLDIQPVNDGPVVANQTLATREDEALSGTLTATDVEGQPLRFVLLSNGALGRAVITNATTGAFTYTPDPNAFGTDSFTVIASDGTDDSQVATITVQIAPTNDAPRAVVSSTSGTQVGVNASLELSGAASSDIEGTLAYRWDFGDGTVLSVGPAVVTHAWTSAGVYTVRLTVTDEGGLSDWTSLTVVVAAASGGGGASPPDSDGDGFSDELETALKTDPHSALSTPLENKPLEEVEPLTITKASISLNFIKAGSDTLSFSGTLPVPKDFNPADETVIIDVEGVIESFTLDKRGNSTSATLPHQFKLAVKARKGVVEAQAARYSIRLKRGEFADNFNAEFANGKLEDPVTRNLLFTVLFNGNYYEVLLPMEIQGSRASYKEPGKLRQPN